MKEPRNLLRQTRHGLMLASLRDRFVGRSILTYGEFSQIEADFLCALLPPRAIVVEAGANIGALTVPLAKSERVAQILAVEPQRLAFQMLCANLALCEVDNVAALWAAMGSKPGRARIPALDPDVDDNFGALDIRGATSGDTVPLVAVDQYELPRCNLIKADVEGMERDVLLGAAATIARCRPLIYVENDRADQSAALIETAMGFDYDAWWHCPPLFNPDNFAGRTDDVWLAETGLTMLSINMICVPKERRAAFPDLLPVKAGQTHDEILQDAA